MLKYKELIHNRKLMSGIYAITLVTALLILALVIKGPEESGKFIVDNNGNVTGIRRNSLKRAERYDLSLAINDEKETIQRNVTLVLQASSTERNGMIPSAEDDRESEIETEVDNLISEIEYSKGKKIRLPLKLHDGTPIRWTKAERKAGPAALLIPLVYVMLVVIMAIATREPPKVRLNITPE